MNFSFCCKTSSSRSLSRASGAGPTRRLLVGLQAASRLLFALTPDSSTGTPGGRTETVALGQLAFSSEHARARMHR